MSKPKLLSEGDNAELERSSLTDEAYSVIRSMVIDGRLVSGQRVTVKPMAAMLKLSATPINSALVRLEREGVLESRLHRGFYVPELSAADMQEIYEMREGLDCIAVRLAARSVSHEQISSNLRGSCDIQEQALMVGDIDAYRAEDLNFHQSLWALSGNKRIRRAGRSLQDQMRLSNAISARQAGRGQKSVQEHLSIVEAIACGDEEAAEKAARQHLQLAAATFSHGLGKAPDLGNPL